MKRTSYVTTVIGKERRQQEIPLFRNWTYVLEKAITNLHKCLWLGLVEVLDNRFEMFRYQTGLNVKIEHRNANQDDYLKSSKAEREKLKALMPMDIYLYEYAKQLYEYRYEMFSEQKKQLKQKQSQMQYREISLRLPEILDGCKYSRLYECHLFEKLFVS